MKMLRFVAALASLLAAGPAFAQWQTPNHSVPLGRGVGVTGFGSAAPGTSGKPLVSTGAATDPAFGNIANSGLTPGVANTAKGSLDGTTVTDLSLPSCTAVNQAWRYANGVGINCASISVTAGFDTPVNFGLTASAAAGALTINVTQRDGTTPTAGSPVLVPFRSLTATAGTVAYSTISAALSTVIPSGATLGTSSSNVPFRVWIFLNANGGTPSIGIATCSNLTTLFPCASWEHTLKTSVLLDTAADSAGVLYASAAVTLDAVRIVGFCDFASGLVTAGTWASSCTTLQVFGPGMKKPGDVVQTVTGSTTTSTSVASTANTATALVASIALTSSANPVKIAAYGQVHSASTTGSTIFVAQIYRNTGTTAIGTLSTAQGSGSNTASSPTINYAFDPPQATPPTQYGLYIKDSAGTDTWVFLSNALSVGTNTGIITLEEIMGALPAPANDNINPGLLARTG